MTIIATTNETANPTAMSSRSPALSWAPDFSIASAEAPIIVGTALQIVPRRG